MTKINLHNFEFLEDFAENFGGPNDPENKPDNKDKPRAILAQKSNDGFYSFNNSTAMSKYHEADSRTISTFDSMPGLKKGEALVEVNEYTEKDRNKTQKLTKSWYAAVTPDGKINAIYKQTNNLKGDSVRARMQATDKNISPMGKAIVQRVLEQEGRRDVDITQSKK